MKIAIPVMEDNERMSSISEHFGHAPYFAFIELNDSNEYAVDILANPMSDHAPGDVPGYLAKRNVQLLIARGIGGRAIQYFDQFGIQVIRGASGNIGQIMEQLINNRLSDTNYEVKDKHHAH